jgi:hypothetical protein
MHAHAQAQTGTRLLARVLGPYLVLGMAVHLARRNDVAELLAGLESNPVVPWVTGGFALLTGLVVIGLIQDWRSGPAIVMGLFGVVVALEGVVLMTAPDTYISYADAFPFVPGAILAGVVGLYLSYVGWIRGD